MSVPTPASPLITPDLRRRLQQRYEEAVRLMQQPPADQARVHELLAECLRADPGNILYLDALLANLRQWQPSRGGLGSWFGWWPPRGGTRAEYSVLSTQYFADQPLDEAAAHNALRAAPEVLLRAVDDAETLVALAAASAAQEHDLTEVRYLRVAVELAPGDSRVLRLLARALTRQGQLPDAVDVWRKLLAAGPDGEAEQAVSDLQGVDSHEAADRDLAEAHAAAGEDLAIRGEREALRLARGQQMLSIARRRAASDRHPRAQTLVSRLKAEQLHQEIEILHIRCERLPGEMNLRLELGRKLKQAGNFSGAIQRLEEARGDAALAAEVLLELGECWQHLRQFDKALDFYRQAVPVANEQPEPRPMALALYRVGVLAAAMGQTGVAREALTRLVAIDSGYKDARQRLDNLPPN